MWGHLVHPLKTVKSVSLYAAGSMLHITKTTFCSIFCLLHILSELDTSVNTNFCLVRVNRRAYRKSDQVLYRVLHYIINLAFRIGQLALLPSENERKIIKGMRGFLGGLCPCIFLSKKDRENFSFEACSEIHLENLLYIIVVCWSIKCTSSD